MRTRSFFPNWLLYLLVGLLLGSIPAGVWAECDYEPDAPDCPCFIDTGAWDPNGVYLQDVANATFGTIVSCFCSDPGDPTCDWNPDPADPDKNFTDSGKPYYQMVLGNDEPFSAFSAAVMLSHGLGDAFRGRGAWCSETVSYWHKHTHIPYAGGYWCDRHMDWMLSSAYRIVNWYTVERTLREITDGEEGRGWFIQSHEVDIGAFKLGVTVPVPGAYIGIKGFARNPDRWLDWDQTGHSLIVDEMVVHRDGYGNVFQVDLTLLQGNSGSPPQVRGGSWVDFESFLPQGSGWLGSRKIFGFGIDLAADGTPIYDPARLHYVDHPFVAMIPPIAMQIYDDPNADPEAIEKAATYAMFLKEQGGPGVSSSSKAVAADKVPDGVNTQWVFPQDLEEPVDIVIDLRTGHPNPVKGIELCWQGRQPPTNYKVYFAAADPMQYQEAVVPDLTSVLPILSQQSAVTVVPVSFEQDGSGTPVRYVKLSFPAQAFGQQGGTLQELRFVYDPGPVDDARNNPDDINYTMDCGRACPSIECLWPANNKFVEVQIKGVTDANGNPVSPSIFAISSDEPTASGRGAGGKSHAPDAFGLGSDTVHLRAERSGNGDGRVYTVYFFADNGVERCKGSVEVRVPHDRSSKECMAADSGQEYEATGIN
jgi:hypothetical protein